ncbi:DNA adenine methylase [Burkholderia sp. JSH-S8]|nr:DNA adenine methylase [Burkholderia sp. JSH-S8]
MASPYYTPLRYPGGKGKLSTFVKAIFRENNLVGGDYVEPYAGGAGIAIELVVQEYADHVHINDLDPAVWAFWHSVLHETDALCALIHETPITIDTWRSQRQLQSDPQGASILEVGFSTFFLNRCNRSGILGAGVIGGLKQDGKWKLDARFNKEELVERIRLIARHRDQISLTNMDAVALLDTLAPRLPSSSFIYLDPPYYVKGGDLYEHHYTHYDHQLVSEAVRRLDNVAWMVSYDDVPQIHALYTGFECMQYTLSYTAQARCRGSEAIFFSPDLSVPEMKGSMRAA